jgi:hypothetical protein
MSEPKCRRCGKGVSEIGGYLERVNEKGIPGIWECRPSCEAKMSDVKAMLAAIEAKEERIEE